MLYMTFLEQLADFNAFAEQFLKQPSQSLTIDEVYSKWWEDRHRDEDLAAVLEAHAQYESGERGEDAFAELEATRNSRREKKHS